MLRWHHSMGTLYHHAWRTWDSWDPRKASAHAERTQDPGAVRMFRLYNLTKVFGEDHPAAAHIPSIEDPLRKTPPSCNELEFLKAKRARAPHRLRIYPQPANGTCTALWQHNLYFYSQYRRTAGRAYAIGLYDQHRSSAPSQDQGLDSLTPPPWGRELSRPPTGSKKDSKRLKEHNRALVAVEPSPILVRSPCKKVKKKELVNPQLSWGRIKLTIGMSLESGFLDSLQGLKRMSW